MLEKLANELLINWSTELSTDIPSNIVKLYHHEGVLVPTVSNEIRTTNERIEDYFVHFMSDKPRMVYSNIVSVQEISESALEITGLYDFEFLSTGALAKARFTYVFKLVDGKWLIANHHSSKLPENIKLGYFM